MIQVRPASERGRTRLDWLDSRHTFSFGDYIDPSRMGFRSLRVINEDVVQPGSGFPRHGHSDMEILTYVLEGSLAHRDSIGTGSVIRPGDLQRMSAGRGIQHSEWNYSDDEPVRLLQIWIAPERRGIPPGYEQKSFSAEERRGRLRLVASPDGAEESLTVHQNARVYSTLLESGDKVSHRLHNGNGAWIQVARGEIDLNGRALAEGDGAAASDLEAIEITARAPADVIVFDLAS